jgi:hypothetical protein
MCVRHAKARAAAEPIDATAIKELPMPRIIVTAEPHSHRDDDSVLLDEQVHSVHLSTGHAASQLVQRLAWAVRDAEDAEDRGRRHPPTTTQQQAPQPSAHRLSAAI